MVKKENIFNKTFDASNIILTFLIVIMTFYPFYYCVVASLSDSNSLINANGLLLLPKGINVKAYRAVFSNPNIQSSYLVTMFVVTVGTSINILMTSIGAFLITRNKFAIKNFMTFMMLFTMYFSGGMIPTYLIVFKYLHLGNTLLALILPGAISVYNLIVMRTNFAAIPLSLEEAAKIDGANDLVLFCKIVMPLSKPIIAVMVLFYGVAHWNSWFNAMIYIQDRSKYPLQLILREILLLNSTESMIQETAGDRYSLGESIKYATIIVATLPILCVYPFIQKYFIKGIMIGAVKG